MKTTTITIKGTHCNSCKMLIEDVAKDIKGIQSCAVNFTTGKTDLKYNDDTDLETLVREVETLGDYKIILSQPL